MLGLVSAEYVNNFLFEGKLLTFVLGHIRRLFGMDSMNLFDIYWKWTAYIEEHAMGSLLQ